ncbi:UNVERIFIED_CONTAM: hypothetical protein Slati_2496000 [Sesamum latifolium]|uniref:Helitron helicase-like domain-containing protein n=1 Tax=Sesamum latifolium TaxID=2727402 RepID=A0AAW2WIU1_9LAMI
MESEPSMHDLVAASAEAERRRERHRVRERERRQAMSTEERQNYLARRRQYYQMRRARTASIGTVGDPVNQYAGSTSGASTSRRQGVDRAVELNQNVDTNFGCINEHNNNSDDFSHRSGLNCARDFHERQQSPRELVDKIKHILDAHNPFVQTLRQLAQRDDILDSIIVGGDEVVDTTNRDIIVQTIGGQLMNVKEFSSYYDPLQYPLLLPYGTYGWDCDCRTVDGTRVTCCDYYAYMLQEIWDVVLFYRHRLLEALEICTNVTKTQYENDKLNTPDDYDHIVQAEIPDKNGEPMLYEAVMRHMIHGPCGEMNVNAPCMKNETCKKNYPKPFAPCTIQGTDSYPIYRRRDDNRSIALDRNCDIVVDNGWVVPYNPWLLLKYDCHINVEICSSIKSIKYLYKYVYEGPDCVVFEVRPGPNYDEISQYVDGRWIFAPEALWKIYKFPMSKIYPSVVRLQIHLPMNNFHYPTFKQAAEKRGFLEEDDSIRQYLIEARAIRMPSALRTLFATILLYCQPTGHKRSLKEFDLPQIAEDYQDLRNISSLIDDKPTHPTR